MNWLLPDEPQFKKACRSKSKIKAPVTVFSDGWKIPRYVGDRREVREHTAPALVPDSQKTARLVGQQQVNFTL